MKPVNVVATVLLLLLAAVMLTNYAKGTLGDWFKSKFLNISPSDNARPVSTGGELAKEGVAAPKTPVGDADVGSTVGAIAGSDIANPPKKNHTPDLNPFD